MDHAAHQPHHESSTPAVTRNDRHAAGHDRHAGHSVAMFRDKFWLSLALTIPVILLSHDVQEWFGYTIPMVPGIEYVPAILGTIIFFYGGMVFIRGAQGELADRKPGMMTLISLAIIVAFVTSWAGTLGFFEVEIWWELATLITIMLLGTGWRCVPSPRRRARSRPLPRCFPTRPSESPRRDRGSADQRLRSDESCSSGRARAFPPTGDIVDGTCRRRRVDDHGRVTRGLEAAWRRRHRRHGRRRRLAARQGHRHRRRDGPVRDHAPGRAGASVGLAGAGVGDRAAAILFYVALAAGAMTLVGWWLLGDPEGALVRTATVLVIACPHALGSRSRSSSPSRPRSARGTASSSRIALRSSGPGPWTR